MEDDLKTILELIVASQESSVIQPSRVDTPPGIDYTSDSSICLPGRIQVFAAVSRDLLGLAVCFYLTCVLSPVKTA